HLGGAARLRDRRGQRVARRPAEHPQLADRHRQRDPARAGVPGRRPLRRLRAAGLLRRPPAVRVVDVAVRRCRPRQPAGQADPPRRVGRPRHGGRGRHRAPDLGAVRLDRLHRGVLGRPHHRDLAHGRLRPVPQAAGVVVAVDHRGPRVHPAVPLQGPEADGRPVRHLPDAVRVRPARLAPRPARPDGRRARTGARMTRARHPTRARYAHGLVIGKFYPPHAGHHHLIDVAAAACARLSVVVAASSVESIPLPLRTAWLREAHPQPHVEIFPVVDDTEIDYGSDEIWSAHVAAFRAGTAMRSGLGVPVPPVGAVFSSEAYGPELAERFSAVHVPVDPPRERFPVSGTAVRDDPVGNWEFLSPAVRAYLARRVVVVGAESTGTTTLARALAAHYARRGGVWAATRWVPEYGRTFTEEKLAAARRETGDPSLWLDGLEWESADFTRIAEHHAALEDAAARSGSPLLVCDTDALATAVWHE